MTMGTSTVWGMDEEEMSLESSEEVRPKVILKGPKSIVTCTHMYMLVTQLRPTFATP